VPGANLAVNDNADRQVRAPGGSDPVRYENHVQEGPLVKMAFVGKGGSGKTTLAALLARHLVATGRPVLAIDALSTPQPAGVA
jgi:Mrp family chromosome partitioning ATPase